jgi:hypothetical protein
MSYRLSVIGYRFRVDDFWIYHAQKRDTRSDAMGQIGEKLGVVGYGIRGGDLLRLFAIARVERAINPPEHRRK